MSPTVGAPTLHIKIPFNYPNRPPFVSFTEKIDHPNVDKNGNICIGNIEH